MRITISNWTYVLAVAVVLGLGCEREVSVPTAPARPSNIPATSLWVGGHDGGVYVLITRSEKLGKDMYFGEIYYGSGDLAYKGPMKLNPANSTDFDPAKNDSYEGWDGDTLHLSNDRYLSIKD